MSELCMCMCIRMDGIHLRYSMGDVEELIVQLNEQAIRENKVWGYLLHKPRGGT